MADDDDDDDRRGSDVPAVLPRGVAEQRAFDALEKDIKEVRKLSIFSYLKETSNLCLFPLMQCEVDTLKDQAGLVAA